MPLQLLNFNNRMGYPITYQRLVNTGSFSGSMEYGVALANATLVRQFSTSSNNSYYRVGIRYRLRFIDETKKSFVATYGLTIPRFILGFCHGTGSVPGDQTIDQFIGGRSCYGSMALTTNDYSGWAGTSTVNFNCTSASYGTNTSTLGYRDNVDVNGGFVTFSTASCDVLFFEYKPWATVNNTTSFVVGFFGRTSTTTNAFDYITNAEMETLMESPSPSFGGYTYSTYFLSIYQHSMSAVQLAQYPLNAVCVSWNYSDPIIEILDLYVSRLG